MGVHDSIFSILYKNTEAQKYWIEICQLHNITKHYLLIAEEICETGQLFLQPLKEHRDAYDHIIRTFSIQTKDLPESFDREDYVSKNLDKAYGHEYRAFFDTVDWLTYNLRQVIRNRIEKMSTVERTLYNISVKAEIKLSLKQIIILLNEYPYKIAEQRRKKDVTVFNAKNTIQIYINIIEKLYKIYKVTPF